MHWITYAGTATFVDFLRIITIHNFCMHKFLQHLYVLLQLTTFVNPVVKRIININVICNIDYNNMNDNRHIIVAFVQFTIDRQTDIVTY